MGGKDNRQQKGNPEMPVPIIGRFNFKPLNMFNHFVVVFDLFLFGSSTGFTGGY